MSAEGERHFRVNAIITVPSPDDDSEMVIGALVDACEKRGWTIFASALPIGGERPT